MLDSVNICFRRSILNCYLMTRSCVSDICSQDHHMAIEELCLWDNDMVDASKPGVQF